MYIVYGLSLNTNNENETLYSLDNSIDNLDQADNLASNTRTLKASINENEFQTLYLQEMT